MKSVLKVLAVGLLAIALALAVRYLYRESSDVIQGGNTTWYEDAMLSAREMFLEKPDDIQFLTAALLELPPQSLCTAADGSVMRLESDGTVSEPDASLADYLPAVFGRYANGGTVLNIEVLEDAILFYTYYGNSGCAGFLYEFERGSTHYYDYVELVENWQLFYHIPA